MKAEDWKEIRRDKWGFLANGMTTEMYDSLPVIVWDSKYEMTENELHDLVRWVVDTYGIPSYEYSCEQWRDSVCTTTLKI